MVNESESTSELRLDAPVKRTETLGTKCSIRQAGNSHVE